MLSYSPSFGNWVDLGSGAGFPGLVAAIALKKNKDRHFTLVEASGKKAAFLRTVIRELGLHASVAAERIETHGPKMAGRADIVSARALAQVQVILRLAAPYLHQDSVLLLLKGENFRRELAEAAETWSFDVLSFPSETDSAARVLAIRDLKMKTGRR